MLKKIAPPGAPELPKSYPPPRIPDNGPSPYNIKKKKMTQKMLIRVPIGLHEATSLWYRKTVPTRAFVGTEGGNRGPPSQYGMDRSSVVQTSHDWWYFR